MTENIPVVEMRNIKKHFAAVQALRGVDLTLHHNEVLGLVGDNAAGKSTLMKVLSGAYIPDGGDILIEGEPAHITDPLRARQLGIEMVYQDLALANNLDVTANVFLGREAVSAQLGPLRVMDSRRMEQEAQRLLEQTAMPCAHIAYETGFSDQSYFTKQFRALTGTTPARHRRTYRQRQR